MKPYPDQQKSIDEIFEELKTKIIEYFPFLSDIEKTINVFKAFHTFI